MLSVRKRDSKQNVKNDLRPVLMEQKKGNRCQAEVKNRKNVFSFPKNYTFWG